MNDATTNETKKGGCVPLWQVAVLFIFLLASILVSTRMLGSSAHIPLLLATILAAFMALGSGYKYAELEEGMAESIKSAAQAILLMLIVGIVVGLWILGGIVPSMIYYGLQILSPSFFLVASLLMCSVISVMTGSSWTTIGTLGVALMGVGMGLGVPSAMTAGAIISGAYFGDKMSPLSETTNLAPAMAGTDVFSHVKHMAKTTLPSYVIAAILFTVLGLSFRDHTVDPATINSYLDCLKSTFTISPIMLIPPICVIFMVIMKVPAIPGMIAVAFLGSIFAGVFQGASMSQIFAAAYTGFRADTGIEAVNNLLNRGGLSSMLDTIALILIALSFAGVLDRSGMINEVCAAMLKRAKTERALLTAALLTTILCTFTTHAYVTMVVNGRMYRDEFKKRNLHPANLSRILEDGGTLCCPLCPWSSDGVYASATLGVATGSYWMYCFLNLINPIISLICCQTGWTIAHMSADDAEKDVVTL